MHRDFLIGAMALLLLFIGIHNAWDTVTYIAAGGLQTPPKNSTGDQDDQRQVSEDQG